MIWDATLVSFSIIISPYACACIDPVPLFEQAIQCQQKLMTAQDLEIENKQLRETLNEYNSEFAHVKNQGEYICMGTDVHNFVLLFVIQ